MTYTLYLAEKPSVAQTLATYLSKKMGVPATDMRTHFAVGNSVKVSNLKGHLLEHIEPHEYDPILKDWSASAHLLPFIPSPFQLKVKERTKNLFAAVKELALGASEVINCADPDDQGELLSMQFLRFIRCKAPIRRMMAMDLTDGGLDRSFSQIQDASAHAGAYYAALAQSDADWLYGINMTRACSLEAQKKGHHLTLNVGRVKTPTWMLIVGRELAIRNFTPVDHYKPWIQAMAKPSFVAKWVPKEDDARLDGEGRLISLDAATAICQAAQRARHATVISAETKPGQEAQPNLFALDTLQAYCSRTYKWSPTKTLEIAQSLYNEKKIISYPRTPQEHLPESHHALAPGILMSLSKAPLPTGLLSALRGVKTSIKSSAFSDKAIGKDSHYAIAPTELATPAVVNALTPEEKALYFEIVRRYIVQFWPAAKVLLTTIELECGGETYTAKGKRYTDEGWRKAFELPGEDASEEPKSDVEDVTLPEVAPGMVLPLEQVSMNKETTKAPKRYTEGTLLTAMGDIHKEVKDPKIRQRLKEKEGIGTPATRAGIIKETVENPLFSLQGKNQEIVPSEDLIKFMTVLPSSMTAPDMTALWQLYFDGIKAGQNTYDDFIRQQTAWLQKLVASVSKFFETVSFDGVAKSGGRRAGLEIQETEFTCTAPNCSAPLKRIKGRHGWFFACSNQECKKLFADLEGMPVEKVAPVKSEFNCPKCNPSAAAEGGFMMRVESKAPKGHYFWGCSAWKNGCKVAVDDDNGKPDFEGNVRRRQSMVDGQVIECPKCGKGHLIRTQRKDKKGYFWGCSDWRSGCKAMFNDDSGKPDIEGRTRGQWTSGNQSAGAGRSGQESAPMGNSATSTEEQPPRWGSTRPPARGAAAAKQQPPQQQASTQGGARRPSVAATSFADRMRRHGGSVAYDPLADMG